MKYKITSIVYYRGSPGWPCAIFLHCGGDGVETMQPRVARRSPVDPTAPKGGIVVQWVNCEGSRGIDEASGGE